MIVNVNNNHWVALIIDFREHMILYGDSIRKNIGCMNSELRLAFKWWATFHTGVRFKVEELPIMEQSDGFSCGILAWNALASHLCNMEIIPASKVLGHHVKVCHQIVLHHLQAKDNLVRQFRIILEHIKLMETHPEL